MSTGQIFLTLASLILLGYISLNIQKMYVSSVETTVDTQMTSDAINFGRDLSEEIQSYAFEFSKLDSQFGGLDDVNNPNKRRTDTSYVGQVFHATVELTSEQTIEHGQTGRIATIRVYEDVGNSIEFKAEFVTAVSNLK